MRKQFYLGIFIMIFLMTSSCKTGNEKVYQGELFSFRYDSIIPELLKERDIPGIAVAITRNGEVIWSEGYGSADLKSNNPITGNTRFNIGSASKTFTAWGVMKLFEEGLIDPDVPVDFYLKRWHLPETQFNNNQVTIRRLLNHTSGLSEYPVSESINGYRPGSSMPTIVEALSSSYGSYGKLRLITQPGSSFKYNNGNYAILQLLIEDVTNESFSNYMQRTIFSPLMLINTNYCRDKNVATPYNEKGQPYDQIDFVEKASGGIFTTVFEFGLFVAAFDSNNTNAPGHEILKPETLELMFEPDKETNLKYGLGYQIDRLHKNGYFLAHQGANEGFRSLFLFDRLKRTGIVVISNSDIGTHIFAEIICIWTEWGNIELSYPCPE